MRATQEKRLILIDQVQERSKRFALRCVIPRFEPENSVSASHLTPLTLPGGGGGERCTIRLREDLREVGRAIKPYIIFHGSVPLRALSDGEACTRHVTDS